jgi:pyrroline-5-carboxylate reductase
VTSPGGTTEAGLDVLDGDGALSALMRATVRAAAERSRALAAAADANGLPPFREAARA